MKIQVLIAAITSILLFFFMINLAFGFMPAVNNILLSLDYHLSWSLSIVDIALIAVIPWIVFGLIRTGEKQTIKHQLGLTALFLIGALVFFTFGFLLIDLTPNKNPLLPSYAKAQPFLHYWSLCFGLNNLIISGMYLFDRKRKRDEQDVVD
jgi:glucan phosphoethanolaminetransferase (alkaline phosphatase superfamily)